MQKNFRGGGSGRGRGTPWHNSNNNGGRPTCQVCENQGHDALRCYHRFDHNYQTEEPKVAAAASASYNLDMNWYADFGASNHLMSDLDRLNVKEHYRGSNQVQVANGTGLSISHIGHSSIAGHSRSLHLNNILHVPRINKHLIYVHKLV